MAAVHLWPPKVPFFVTNPFAAIDVFTIGLALILITFVVEGLAKVAPPFLGLDLGLFFLSDSLSNSSSDYR
jgi:hypothetical protein